MGAGQIGGIATLLDIDFDNAAGFLGTKADLSEAQFIVFFLSHALMFCTGALIEAHIVLTPAICVYGERNKFDVFAGTHRFLERYSITRKVNNICLHKGYNHTLRWEKCSPDNLALLVLDRQYSFHQRESHSEYVIDRIRYGGRSLDTDKYNECYLFGWGSRRNGYLVPLLMNMYKVQVTIMPKEECYNMWNINEKYLCVYQPPCRSAKYGALCPDDVGSVIECGGFIMGMMTSRLIDRPCGVGFLDMTLYKKFLTCGVDDSRDVIEHDGTGMVDFTTVTHVEELVTLVPHNKENVLH